MKKGIRELLENKDVRKGLVGLAGIVGLGLLLKKGKNMDENEYVEVEYDEDGVYDDVEYEVVDEEEEIEEA